MASIFDRYAPYLHFQHSHQYSQAVEQGPIPVGKVNDPPLFDPKTGEACAWPPPPNQTGASPPTAIYAPEPAYSDAARADKMNGSVMLVVDLGTDGLVKRACVLSASRDDLARQALYTVRTWRFHPATKDGSPIPWSTRIEVAFRIAR